MKTKAEQSVQNYVHLNNHTYIFYVWLLSVHKNLMYGLKFYMLFICEQCLSQLVV